jgi:hypothetical protein
MEDVMAVEAPAAAAPSTSAQEAAPGLPDDHPEMVAGRRAAAKHGAAAGERLKEEMEAGQRTLAKFRT